jgi:hypothetical protein
MAYACNNDGEEKNKINRQKIRKNVQTSWGEEAEAKGKRAHALPNT